MPWGEKAFSAYMGNDRETWKQHDASELVKTATMRLPLLVDQGDGDEFVNSQLKPQLLRSACESAGYPLQFNLRPGYDHSYYFIASFIGEHIAFHAKAMREGV